MKQEILFIEQLGKQTQSGNELGNTLAFKLDSSNNTASVTQSANTKKDLQQIN